MNLPNKLTTFRVVLVPFFVIFMLSNCFGEYSKYAAFAVFVVASLTDLLDGKIARKYNLVTDFGKFMDPLADKLLVISAMICLMDMGKFPSWILIIIVSREFIISGFRLIAADNGVVIAAGIWGKLKTVCQMIMILVLILDFSNVYYYYLEQVLIYLSLILTIVSLVDYIYHNKEIIKDTK
ncbi:CDP-diacylglycerol--glycerol-3-phosphate 3-phosphatidyltransferase [Acetitomaculum ruminis DSM 5522]|uniref:CDP-diacylglycerol--glycerol-3-phosphate 3-phosphatidyltransferase n=1 Tax=Acetitomaculum ruminis DSM 5522 TaxID=1120918 RepID=A0A1I0VS71_9FIRM|nr:CDP-diacylglycerol--glycerol-3-phosphate 3-phosphatidyltransferase [Acetitomaculum ruminis]SFA79184.1 CDP-diacylglycerol--glycerol-3-phosphate 3-phosphatidyltransferase [Acetitomaculum ruminis DSM 5522]